MNPKYLPAFLLIFISILSCTELSAQKQEMSYHSMLIPEEMKENASSVIRKYDEVYTVIDDNSANYSVTKAVTILKPSSDENEMVLYYDADSKISGFKVSIYDSAGNKVRDAKKSEIEDVMAVGGGQFYTDSRVKYITVENPTYPYTIEFSYNKKLTKFGIVEFPVYYPQQYEQSVMFSRLQAIIPTDNELLYDLHDLPEPTVSIDGENRIYDWKVKMLPAKSYEPYAPQYSKVLPNVRTVLKRFEIIRGEKSTFESWEGFGKMMNSLIAGRNTLPPELVMEAKTAIASAETDREKIAILYRLMQDRVRYVGVQLGVGGWQPFSADYVERNRYGDCKALSNYMMSLLEVAEIESYPTLIYSGRESYSVRDDFPTSAFNHMILYVPSEEMYLECTSNYLPAGYISEGTMDRNVLWVTPQGGKLARTPALDPAENGHLRSQHITLAEDGSASIDFKSHYVGAPHEKLRTYSKYMSEEEFKKFLQQKEILPDVTGSNYRLRVSETEPTVDLEYGTTLPRYARKMGKRFFVPVNKLFAYDRRLDKDEGRENEIIYNHPRFLVDSVYLTLPEGLSLEALGEPTVDIVHPAGEYHAEISYSGNKIRWVRTLKLLPVKLPASEYDGFREFFLAASKADRRQLVFKSVTK